MTEAEWLACTDPMPMLLFLRGKASDRKLRLFGVACCRSVCITRRDVGSRRTLELAERYADGEVANEQFAEAEAVAWDVILGRWNSSSDAADSAVLSVTNDSAFEAARSAQERSAEAGFDSLAFWTWRRRYRLIIGLHLAYLRCIFGPLPFRPITFDPGWQTSTALALANGIYQERAFDRLPILADALEESGCDQPDILTHLRSDGPHVRGCWALDLALGKE